MCKSLLFKMYTFRYEYKNARHDVWNWINFFSIKKTGKHVGGSNWIGIEHADGPAGLVVKKKKEKAPGKCWKKRTENQADGGNKNK